MRLLSSVTLRMQKKICSIFFHITYPQAPTLSSVLKIYFLLTFCVIISVADPDLNPDLYVFGPPGSVSGSIGQRHGSGSGSFYRQAKIVRKALISTVLILLFDFLSLKNDINVVWSAQVKHERGGMLGRVNLGLSGYPSIIYQYFVSGFSCRIFLSFFSS
jgi:hypothetical protein